MPAPPPPPSAARWEYKILELASWEDLAEEELNQLGADRWEMVGMSQMWAKARFIFKRKRLPPRKR